MNPEHRAVQLLLRSWPFPRGAGRMVDRFFSRISFREEQALIRTTDGFDLTVLPNDLIGRHIYLTGEFDRSNVEVLLNFAKSDDVFLDIGANIGYVSACILQNVPRSTVISIEPQPVIVDLLKRNLAQFKDRHIVLNCAVSDYDGMASFSVNAHNFGAGQLSVDGETTVDVRSAKSLLENISKIDLVKIDVEGHEQNVMVSCRDIFELLKPRIIVFEDHGRSCFGPLGSLIREINYDLYGIRKMPHRLDLVPIMLQSDCVYNDYAAVCRSRSIPRKAAVTYTSLRSNYCAGQAGDPGNVV